MRNLVLLFLFAFAISGSQVMATEYDSSILNYDESSLEFTDFLSEPISFDWDDQKDVSIDAADFCVVFVTWETETSSGEAGVACDGLWDWISQFFN